MLIFSFVALALCLLSFAVADPAPLSKNNPKNIVAVADFPESGTNKFTKGYVYFTSPKGSSIKVHVDMTGLPPLGGPFVYHIHEGQIFDKVSCDEAGKQFDPFKGLEKCAENSDDALCMVGDLSGKHGWINATCFQTEYHDKYLSLNPASESYIVGRSIVFHDQKLTQFACANINLASAEQYRDLFGAPDKSSGSHDADLNRGNDHAREIPNENPQPAAPAPNPAPDSAPQTPTEPVAPQPISAPIQVSEVQSEAPSEATSTAAVSSTAGTIAEPTSATNADKADAGNGFVHKSTETPSPGVLLSSDASSYSFVKRLVGTALGVFLGIFF